MSAPRLTDARLGEIRARVSAATPGPWMVEEFANIDDAREEGAFRWTSGDPYDGGPVGAVYRLLPSGGNTGLPGCVEASQNDAALIAHAPADLADLLAEMDALRAERDALAEKYEVTVREWQHAKEAHEAKEAKSRELLFSLIGDAPGPLRPPGHITDLVRELAAWSKRRDDKGLSTGPLHRAINYLEEFRELVAVLRMKRSRATEATDAR